MNAVSRAKPVALITGATSGLGLALTQRWSQRYRLILTGSRAAFPEDLPNDAIYIAADQSQPSEAVRTIEKTLSEIGTDALGLAVLNAGTGRYGDPFDEDAATLRHTLAVNLEAPVALAHALFPRLERASGRLVLIGSVAQAGSANLASYAASKGGLDAFARALREEWLGRVGVSMLHPGPIATEMHAKAGFDPKGMRRIFASPERMAAMVAQAIEKEKPRVMLGTGATLIHKLRHGARF